MKIVIWTCYLFAALFAASAAPNLGELVHSQVCNESAPMQVSDEPAQALALVAVNSESFDDQLEYLNRRLDGVHIFCAVVFACQYASIFQSQVNPSDGMPCVPLSSDGNLAELAALSPVVNFFVSLFSFKEGSRSRLAALGLASGELAFTLAWLSGAFDSFIAESLPSFELSSSLVFLGVPAMLFAMWAFVFFMHGE